jgi:dimeric dUTPase (all-alpha-NTP-PPase superfamily)
LNPEKMFKTQKELRKVGLFTYNGPDRFNKLALALLVELGEGANEWRGFKFWSKDQKPRTHKARHPYMDADDADFYNPLLEEHVDSLHFVLELGIEKGFTPERVRLVREENTTDAYLSVIERAVEYSLSPTQWNYNMLFERFIELGEHLGFTWAEIEQAYYEKNKINHQRQEQGY